MRARLTAVLIVLIAVLGGLPLPAHASGSGALEFQVSGTLNPFPTANGTTTFRGQGTGVGSMTGSAGGATYEASFSMLGMPVAGAANYSELGWPVCPLVGSATPPLKSGWITIGKQALPSVTGLVYRAGAAHSGTVTGLVVHFGFSYQRVGLQVVLTVTGTATVYFYYPGTGYGSFSSTFTGAGTGVFHVDPVQAELNCMDPYNAVPLPYTLTGAIAVAG